ncbi:MAG: transposase [Firmicutes bacterium]|nr:transposase [Bacillota bacterium]MDD4692993.1 transposase [Bacillota bacterium]
MGELQPAKETLDRHVIEAISRITLDLVVTICGEVSDIHRFKDAEAVVLFAGIDAFIRMACTRNRMSKYGSLFYAIAFGSLLPMYIELTRIPGILQY